MDRVAWIQFARSAAIYPSLIGVLAVGVEADELPQAAVSPPASTRSSAPPAYTFAFLPGLGGAGTYNTPAGINDSGQIVGASLSVGGPVHAVSWVGGKITDLDPGDTAGRSQATAVNRHGFIVGGFTPTGQTQQSLSVVWKNGLVLARLPTPCPAAQAPCAASPGTTASGISDTGLVAGSIGNDAVAWYQNANGQIGTLFGAPSANPDVVYAAVAVNNRSQLVGQSQALVAGGPGSRNPPLLVSTAVWWNASATPVALAALPGSAGNPLASSAAVAINDAGQIVGYATSAAGTTYAVQWQAGAITQLADLGEGGGANAINSAGQIAGYANLGGISSPSVQHAVVWIGGKVFDLNTYLPASDSAAGWVLSNAVAINGSGVVVGIATNQNPELGPLSFVLTPQ